MTEKRKRLNMQQKMEITGRLRYGESIRNIASEYSISLPAVYKIKNNSKLIEAYTQKLKTTDGNERKRKSMKCAANNQLEDVMFQWFKQKRSQGIPLSGQLVSEKAIEMNRKLGGNPNFKASSGWLKNFKSRHGIRQLSIQGKNLSGDTLAISSFVEELHHELTNRNLTKEQVYNCDETGLNWKALPIKTLASASEECYKMQKERLTVLVCSNASGNHKLPLVIIGTSKEPAVVEGLNTSALPVKYYHQKNAWMSQEIFIEWFHSVFLPEVCTYLRQNSNLPEEAMLLMDSAPVHPIPNLQSDDGKITCHFLPANTTPLIQPMDQGIKETLKRRYRKVYIQNLLRSDNETNVTELWKKYTITDAVYNIAHCWSDILPETVQRCWHKLFPPEETTTEMEDTSSDSQISELLETCTKLASLKDEVDRNTINAWLEMDKFDVGYNISNDDEIVRDVLSRHDVPMQHYTSSSEESTSKYSVHNMDIIKTEHDTDEEGQSASAGDENWKNEDQPIPFTFYAVKSEPPDIDDMKIKTEPDDGAMTMSPVGDIHLDSEENTLAVQYKSDVGEPDSEAEMSLKSSWCTSWIKIEEDPLETKSENENTFNMNMQSR